MVLTIKNLQYIRRIIKPLIGQTSWGIKLLGEKGTHIIVMHFGNRHLSAEIDSAPYGDWILRIFSCAWRLDSNDKILAGAMDDTPKQTSQLAVLETLSLVAIRITRPALDTTLNFNNQVYLRLFPVYMNNYYHWKLQLPNADRLTIGPGSNWSYEKPSTHKP